MVHLRNTSSWISSIALILSNPPLNNSGYGPAVSPLVISDSHRRVGKLPGGYRSTVSVGWINLYQVSCAFTYMSSSKIFTADTSCPCCVNHTHEHINILDHIWNTWSILWRTWISGTRVRQTWGKWYTDNRYSDTIIPHAGLLSWFNVGLAKTHPS